MMESIQLAQMLADLSDLNAAVCLNIFTRPVTILEVSRRGHLYAAYL